MIKYILIWLAILATIGSNSPFLMAQSPVDRRVVAAAGGSATAGSGATAIDISFTVGEAVIGSFSAGSSLLTVGFQQPSSAVPTITSVNPPASGTYAAGQVLTYTVVFNVPVVINTSAGSPSLPLIIGTTPVNASYVSGSGTTSITFRYATQCDQRDADGIAVGSALSLNGSTIQSSLGDNADLTLNGVANTTVVLVGPPVATLSSSNPISETAPSSTLTAPQATGASYRFVGPGLNQSGAANTASVTQPGYYSVTLTSAQGCTSIASTTVTGATSASSCRNGSAVITVIASGSPVKYEWYRNSITSARLTENPAQVRGTSTSSLTLVNQQVTANYYVRVTDANGAAVVYGPFKMTVDLSCNIYARVGTEDAELTITLLGNPISEDQLRATVRGAEGQALHVQLLDESGYLIRTQQWQQAEADQRIEWQVGNQPGGVYLLQATTSHQRRSVKLIKQ